MVKGKCIRCETNETETDNNGLIDTTQHNEYKYFYKTCYECGCSSFFVDVNSDYWSKGFEIVYPQDTERIPDSMLDNEDHRCSSCGGRSFKYDAPMAAYMCVFCSFTS